MLSGKSIFTPTKLAKKTFIEILPSFFEELKEDFIKLEIALVENTCQKGKDIAHKIKGSAASYGAILIRGMAIQIHNTITLGQSKDFKFRLQRLRESIETSHEYAKKEFGIE